MLKLRRDGFASMGASGGVSGVVVTSVITWEASLHYLFVNCNCTGGLKVAVLDANGKESLLFGSSASVPFVGDSTRHMMQWTTSHSTHGLAPVAGDQVRLRFELGGGSQLFAFWLSATECGESRGFVAGGGPGLDGNRDSWGVCPP